MHIYLSDMNLLFANQFLEALPWHMKKQMLLHPMWSNKMLKSMTEVLLLLAKDARDDIADQLSLRVDIIFKFKISWQVIHIVPHIA